MIWGRVLDVFRRRRLDADLQSQLAHHLDGLEAEARAQGLSPHDARAAARRAMGGLTQVEDAYHDQLTIPLIDTLWQDVRYACRAMRRDVSFTIVVVMTLALGIGANAAVFSVLNSVLLKPLSFPRSEELVKIRHIAPGATGSSASDALNLSPSMYFTYAEHNRVFQSLGVWIATIGTVTGVAEPEQVRAIGVSDGVLQALNVAPAAGRWLLAEDQHGPPRPLPSLLRSYNKVMLSYGYWQHVGGDRSVIGRTIMVDGRPKEIVGVMPRGFKIVDAEAEMLFPIAFDRGRFTLAGGGTGGFGYQSVARLRPGVTIAQANADVARMVPIWMSSWSNGAEANARAFEAWKITPALRPLKQEVVGGVTEMLWVVMATIGLVMLIACANVANLLLVRAEVRQRELAVRAALGAGRGRIVRSLLIESLLLSLVGGAVGGGLAYAGVRVLVAIGPTNLPRLAEISVDVRTVGFTAVLSLLSSLLFGLIPALKYTGPQIAAALGSIGRAASVSRDRHRARNVLVVVQVALALVLLVSAGLMIRTFESLRTVDPGFADPDHLQVMRLFISAAHEQDAERTSRLEHAIQDKLASIPGVTSAAFGSAMPLEAYGPNLGVVNSGPVVAEDRTEQDQGSSAAPQRLFKYVSPGFFRTAGTQLLAGRDITWTDIYGLRPVVLMSENLAREFWGTPAGAVGRRVRQDSNMPWHEVIGVVQDVREDGLYQPAPRVVYWASMSAYIGIGSGPKTIRGITYIVRSERPVTEAFLSQLQQAVWSVNSGLPVLPRTMRDVYARSLARTSFTLVMLAIAASMALLLGVVGIYGVIAYAVSQRRREIGIRAALGAQQAELKGMFVRHGLVLAGIGVVIGLGAAAGLTRLMSSLLYGITPLDPVTYVAVPLVLVTVTVLVSYVPARRAAAVDPVEALRVE